MQLDGYIERPLTARMRKDDEVYCAIGGDAVATG